MSDAGSHIKPSPYIISRCFRDIDEIADVMRAKRGETHLVQLELQPLKAEILQGDFDDFLIFKAHLNSAIHHTGNRRKNYIHFMGFLNPQETRTALIHKRLAGANTLWNFDCTRQGNTILPAHVPVFDLQIRREQFEQYCQIMGREDLLKMQFLRTDIIDLPLTLSTYRNQIQEILHLIEMRSPLLYESHYPRLIREDLIPLLIDSIPVSQTRSPKNPSPVRKAKLAYQIREYILNHLERPLTLKELYTELGMSRRNLFYTFEDIFGVTPMRYLKIVRLQMLRRGLKVAAPETTTVMSLASRWGFWSAGHLARDYKMMFGELPSQTLQSPNLVRVQ